MERRIQYMNWIDFKKLVPQKIDTVIFPIGTIEAHGIIPLGTDNIIPEEISQKVAVKIDALIAPTFNYGITHSLLPYPGSLTLNAETFENAVTEIAYGLAENKFKTVIFLNGHGGHLDELKRVSLSLWKEKSTKSIVIHWWFLTEELTKKVWKQEGGHAGLDETAMIYATDKRLVKKGYLKKDMAAVYKPGLKPMPFHGSIILYKKGEGFPKLDKRCDTFFNESVKLITKEIKEVMRKWKSI
jgi:creatinine amidohydrolase